MTRSKENIMGSSQQWLDFIYQSYSDPFLQHFINLDQLLCNKSPDYISGSFYNKLLAIFHAQIEGRKNLNMHDEIGLALLKALCFTCKEAPVTSNYLGQNPDIKDLFIKLQDLFSDITVMIQAQDSFDELKKNQISNN